MAIATFVKGAKQQIVIELSSASSKVSMVQSTPCCFCRDIVGGGSSAPSNPVFPCTCSAVTKGRTSGREHPANTFVSGFLASSQSIKAFREVNATGTFPATVTIPRTSSSAGEASASKIPIASS